MRNPHLTLTHPHSRMSAPGERPSQGAIPYEVLTHPHSLTAPGDKREKCPDLDSSATVLSIVEKSQIVGGRATDPTHNTDSFRVI